MDPSRAITPICLCFIWGYAAFSSFTCCGGLRYCHVVFLGHLRVDLAILALSALTALILVIRLSVCCCRPCLRSRSQALVLVAGGVAVVAYGVSRVSQYEFVFQHGFNETKVSKLSPRIVEVFELQAQSSLSTDEVARAVAAVQAAAPLWIHMSEALGIMYFNLGYVHDGFRHDTPLPSSGEWSLQYGYFSPHHLQSHNMPGPSYAQSLREWQSRQDVSWIYARYRQMVAEALNVSLTDVVLGGEAGAEALGLPTFHIYGPSIVWQFLLNPHYDAIYKKESIGGVACGEEEEVKSFSLSLSMPEDSGLIHWTRAGRVHTAKPEGGFISWDGEVLHSLKPWRYSLSKMRITLQSFASRCGSKWFVYH